MFCVLVHIGTVEVTEDGVNQGSLTAYRCGQHVQLGQLDHRPDGLGEGGLRHGGVLEQGEGVLDGGVEAFCLGESWKGHCLLLPHGGLCKVFKCPEKFQLKSHQQLNLYSSEVLDDAIILITACICINR